MRNQYHRRLAGTKVTRRPLDDTVKPAFKPGDELQVAEGVESMWHYHLAPKGSFVRSLCGRRTMLTSITLERWGRTPANYHIPEKWCAECARIAGISEQTTSQKAT